MQGGLLKWPSCRRKFGSELTNLDAVGNTTAAIGKGFAIGSAALTALALFAAYMQQAGVDNINVADPVIMAGLLLGAMLPYVFSAMAMGSRWSGRGRHDQGGRAPV